MTGIVLWIVRVVVLLFVVRLVLRMLYPTTARRSAPRRPARVPERSGGTLVRDPHCGTYIPESRALVVGHGADAWHFCSAACRDAWMAAHSGAQAKA